MDVFCNIAEKIIQAQENIIGPVALEQAKKVSGLNVDWVKRDIQITGNKKTVLESLITQYGHLFGRASIEVCREAVKSLIQQIPKDQLPPSLAS